MNNNSTDFFKGDLLADVAWKKYKLDTESSPVQMYERCAKEFFDTENKYVEKEIELDKSSLSDYGQTRKNMSYDWILNSFLSNKIVLSGSVKANLGNEKFIGSLSNCFAQKAPHDSYSGIFESDEILAQLMKRRGGVGMPISTLRPEGAKVNNAAKSSTGAVSFMHRFSNTTNEVAQNGRRGALLLMMLIRHPDISDFINIKQDLSNVTGANISTGITNDFMRAVENDEDFILRWPCQTNCSNEDVDLYNVTYERQDENGNTIYIRKVRAKKIWNEIMLCAWKTGEPGIIFMDNHWDQGLDSFYPEYKMIITNPCGEIGMGEDETCRLIHIKVSSFVVYPYTEDAYFDYETFYKYCYELQRLNDDLVDLEIKYIDRIISAILSDFQEVNSRELELWQRIRAKAEASRRTGTGSLAWADTLAMLGFDYASEASFEVIDKIAFIKCLAEIQSSQDMAITRGKFTGCDAEMELRIGNKFITDFEDACNRYCINFEWKDRRNVSTSTIAPTGTAALEARCSAGLEPIFDELHWRNVKQEADSEDYDFIDNVGVKFKRYPVYHPPIKDWIAANPTKPFEKNPWHNSTASKINWKDRIKIQSILQKYTTHSISSTINLPSDISVDVVGDIYFEAWKQGLKGITVYRDGSRSGILVKDENVAPKEKVSIKRPKEVDAYFHSVRVNGKKFGVIIGILNDEPYEIFALEMSVDFREKKGVLVKVEKGRYDFIAENFIIEKINATTEEQKAVTLLASMALRNGVPAKEILHIINKVSNNITDFSAAVARILKRYLKDKEGFTSDICPACEGKIVYENGCKICKDCGYSACS